MKSYKNLYEKLISEENIKEAIANAYKGKDKKHDKKARLLRLKKNPDNVKIVRNWIINYKPTYHKPTEIYDGIKQKKRIIYVPTLKETVIQHALVQILDNCLGKSFYEHSYAAVKGKGQHKAKDYIFNYIKTNPDKIDYFFKMDIKKYFPSVPKKILMQKLRKYIHDWKVLKLVEDNLYVGNNVDGLPLGFYISQWFANWYLTKFDHSIKEKFCVKLYIRWMDDIVIFSSNKLDLYKYRDIIKKELFHIGLRVKDDWQISYFINENKRGKIFDYMGFGFYRIHITLRRSIYYRTLRKIHKMSKKEKPTLFDIRQLISRMGWIEHCDLYNEYETHIKPFINIKQLKKRISNYDKRIGGKLNGRISVHVA